VERCCYRVLPGLVLFVTAPSLRGGFLLVAPLDYSSYMSNTGVVGRVVDEVGAGVEGLRVAAYDKDGLFGDNFLGASQTLANGNFIINYPAGAYGLEANPDIVVRVYSKVRQPLFERAVQEDFSAPTLDIGTIKIAREAAVGLTVTLGNAAPQFKTSGNQVEFLIDNDEAWDRLIASVKLADTSIHLIQLIFDTVKNRAVPEQNGPRWFARFLTLVPQTVGDRLDQELVRASQRGVAVRLLLNDFRLFYGIPILGGLKFPDYPVDSSGLMVDYLRSLAPPSNIELRMAAMPCFVPVHSKMVIIDGREAFTIGSPFLAEYFDDRDHRIDNGKRGWMHLVNQIKVPVHDVSSYLTGPAVASLDETFCLHWNTERGGAAALAPVAPPPADPAGIQLQVNRSLYGEKRYPDVPKGEAGIYESYLRAISRAKDYIYLENQYFTSDELCDALVLALTDPTRPNLQLIMVINAKVDIPKYGTWQSEIFSKLLAAGSGAVSRVGIFTLWSHEPADAEHAKPRIIRNYVHSKVAIIDDSWATVGSANLDGTGLVHRQDLPILTIFLLGIPSLINLLIGNDVDFASERSSETNIAIFEDDFSVNPAVTAFRKTLWAEHFGARALGAVNPDDASVTTRPAEGWLKRWQDTAAAKLQGLRDTPNDVLDARVLPLIHYGTAEIPDDVGDPVVFLKRSSIDPNKIDIVQEVSSFSYTLGNFIP
jgi:phosphatidylserine/phosphatidylglycerophosphate/cardiolipin synthase-like enzyme